MGGANLVVEEVDGVSIELKRQCLKERYVVGHNLLVREIQFQNDNGVDMIVREQIIYGSACVPGLHIHICTYITILWDPSRKDLQMDVSFLMFSNRILRVCSSCRQT